MREREREREDDLKERFELHRVTMFTDKTEARISLMESWEASCSLAIFIEQKIDVIWWVEK